LIDNVPGALACARRIKFPPLFERNASTVATCAIVSVAAFRFIERLAGFGA
jgi:hypothetical protein